MGRKVAAALLSAVLAAGPTLAGDAPAPSPTSLAPTPLAVGSCIWAGLPRATREALTATGPRIHDFMHAVDAMNPSLLDVARSQCPPVADKDRDAVAAAWTAVILTAWAGAQLKAHYGVSAAALAQSWRHVGPETRAKLAADLDKTPGEARPDLAGQAAELGLATPDGQDLMVFWSMTQLKLEALGG